MILVIGGAYQGKGDFVRNVLGAAEDDVLYNAHEKIRAWLDAGRDPWQEMADALSGKTVVTCDEIGMGIVPIEKSERVWREVTGRIMCDTAKAADTVYRVQCGIAVKIKG